MENILNIQSRQVWLPGNRALNSRMKAHLAFRVIFPTLALSLSVISAQGQSGTISGFVRDSTDGESLSYVNVFVPRTSVGAVTNRDGYYVIAHMPRGQASSIVW